MVTVIILGFTQLIALFSPLPSIDIWRGRINFSEEFHNFSSA